VQPITINNENIETATAIAELNTGYDTDDIIQLGDYDFDGFQVVRREFFAHTTEPAVSFTDCKMYVNAACLQSFPNTEYVQVLINRKAKIMAIMPCEEGDRDSFKWCRLKGSKLVPKFITCKLFFMKMFDFMEWNVRHRYKLLGKLVCANGKKLIAFDLTATEVYQRIETEGEKPKMSRKPVFPLEWQNQFGLPYDEHKQSMQIDIFNGYAVYSIKDLSSELAQAESQPEEATNG